MSSKTISLETIARGGLAEQFEHNLNEVMSNIADPNTNPTKARTITVKITIKPNVKRDAADVSCSVTNSIVSSEPVTTAIYIEKIGSSIVATEATGYDQPSLLGN